MEKNHLLVSITLSSLLLLGAFIGVSLLNQIHPLSAIGHVCKGNHYQEIAENELEPGCHEYWVCCECHNIYLSANEIANYSPSNWVDNDKYQRIISNDDIRHIPSLFEETISKEGSNFTASNNSLTGSLTNDGWIVSKGEYYNFSMDVIINVSSRCNPWGDHKITNAIVIGGKIEDGNLSGYVLQVQDCFTQLFYLDGINDNLAGNCIVQTPEPWTDYKNRSLHISVEKDVLSVSYDGNKLFNDVHLNMQGYKDGYDDYSTSNITYDGGHIGLFSYEDSLDPSRRGTTLTINNFVKGDYSILANSSLSNKNWNISNNHRVISSNEDDGYLLSNDTYDDVSLRAKADKGVSPNIWSTHVAYNSIIIGGDYYNNNLHGYVIEIQNNHFEVAELTGNGFNTSSVICKLGHWGDGGADFISANKNLYIDIKDNVLTLSSMDELERNKEDNPNQYPSVSVILDNYHGGKIGYLSHQEGAHIISIDRLDLSSESSDYNSIDVIKGRFLETGNSLISKSGDSLCLLKDYSFSEGTYLSKVCANDINECGLIFLSNEDATAYYSFVLRGIYGSQIVLNKFSNGVTSELGSCYISAGYSSSNTVTLKVEYQNGDIKCFINDSMLIYRVDDNPLNGNRLGFITKNNDSTFSNYSKSTSRNFRSVDTLIIGHSYMELWSNYKNDLSKYSDIANIGIGGTATHDWANHRNEVRAFAPNRLIYMIGINDVARNIDAQTIIDNIKTLIDGVMLDLPSTKICLLSINRCVNVDSVEQRNIISKSNALLKTYVNSHSNLYYGDLDSAFLNGSGEPDPSCFVDGLHPTSEAYQTIANAIYSSFGD